MLARNALFARLGVLLSAKQRDVADDVGMNAGNRQRQAAGGRGGIEGAAHHVAECLALAAQQRDRAHRNADVFATPDGQPGVADPLMLRGKGLDLWGWIPFLRRVKLIGLALRADARARAAHAQMLRSAVQDAAA